VWRLRGQWTVVLTQRAAANPAPVLLRGDGPNNHSPPHPPTPARNARREKEIKQLQGWKATVENTIERFDDLTKQTQLLQDIEASVALGASGVLPAAAGASASGAAADGAAAGARGAGAAPAPQPPLGPMAAAATRSSVLTPHHHMQLNKLRCAARAARASVGACVCVCV
jgi:hypothetical protein